MIEYFVITFLALGAGCALGGALQRLQDLKATQYRCPWVPCGYPLSKTPLKEEVHAFGRNEFATEPCPECAGLVRWNPHHEYYERVKAEG